jgi:hypothetical protein
VFPQRGPIGQQPPKAAPVHHAEPTRPGEARKKEARYRITVSLENSEGKRIKESNDSREELASAVPDLGFLLRQSEEIMLQHLLQDQDEYRLHLIIRMTGPNRTAVVHSENRRLIIEPVEDNFTFHPVRRAFVSSVN